MRKYAKKDSKSNINHGNKSLFDIVTARIYTAAWYWDF